MGPEMLERLRAELEAERGACLAELRRYGADPDSEEVEPIAGVDEGFADSGAATAERAEALALIDTTRDRLADVERALERMDEGVYGVCERCGEPIAEARLEARPWSVRCVACAGGSRSATGGGR